VVTSAASAEGCDESKDRQPRMIESDGIEYSHFEKQQCLGGEWVTFVSYDTSNEREVIHESINNPLNSDLKLDARSFFELKNYDPYAIVQDFQRRIETGLGLDGDESVEFKLKLASSKVQSLLMRATPDANTNCQVRSVVYTDLETRTGQGWLPPASNGPSGSSTITYDFSAEVPTAVRTVILNAIDQYHYAVVSQDSALAYPDDIVRRAPDDMRAPTILFTMPSDFRSTTWYEREPMAVTVIDWDASAPSTGGRYRWKSGEIRLNPMDDARQVPTVIGHEIGHVMGLKHLPSDVVGIMNTDYGSGWSTARPWTPGAMTSAAFDPCLFRPVDRPLY
jgi:hypothetical protein